MMTAEVIYFCEIGVHRLLVHPPTHLSFLSLIFLLQDLENTIGSWDLYGQEDKNRYNSLQSEFFERAAGGLTLREYLNGLVALGGAAILLWGAKGSQVLNLPITKGPQTSGEAGPRGRK